MPFPYLAGRCLLLLTGVIGLAACQPDYPATGEVSVVNDSGTAVSLAHCTTSCKADDLVERQTLRPGGVVTVGVNGDPHFNEAYIVSRADGTLLCLLADAAVPSSEVSSAVPLAKAADCRATYLDHPPSG